MSNSFTLLENAANNDPQEIAQKTKEVKQEKPKVVEEKKAVQQRKPKPTSAPSEVVEEGFQSTATKVRGGRPQHHQAPKKGRAMDRHVSGTGTKKGEVKKGGGGKANWGKPTEEKEEKPVVEASEAVGEPAKEDKKVEESTTPVEPPKEEDKSQTLEEYLNSRKTKQVSLKKEAGEQLVTGKNVKLTGSEFERGTDESLFQKEKKKVEKDEKTVEKKADKKPKTVDVSEFLDSASLEKIKARRDKEYLEGPKREFTPRTGGDRGDRQQGTRPARGGNNQNKDRKPKTPGAVQNKPKPTPKKEINKEKDFPALNPQN